MLFTRKHERELIFNILFFQEFQQTKAIDWQALIGNVSGYVGVCLGFSLLQIPYLFENCFGRYKK